MKIIFLLLLGFSLGGNAFKSFEAEFTFSHHEFGDFKMTRKFIVNGSTAQSSFKLRPLLIFEYSQKSKLNISGSEVTSIRTEVKNNIPGVNPSFFAVNFSDMGVVSEELEFNITKQNKILDQLGSDLQMRLNIKNNIAKFSFDVIDNDKGNVVTRTYAVDGSETIKTSFGEFNCVKVSATADTASKIIYYLAPELDYFVIKSLVELKNGKINTLKINKRPKFLEG